MLILQQRPGLQDLAEELQIRATYMFIGLIAGDQLAQIRPEIEVQARLPSPSTEGEHVPQRRLAGSRRSQQQDGRMSLCGSFLNGRHRVTVKESPSPMGFISLIAQQRRLARCVASEQYKLARRRLAE
jgi:hypothetical protein